MATKRYKLFAPNKLIDDIESLKKEWQSLQPLKIEQEKKLWEKLSLEWNYNSNHIEGNTLTYGETKLLLFFGQTEGTHDIREYEEMKAHDAAIEIVREWAIDKERELTEADIRSLNKVILKEPYWKEAITPDGQKTRKQIKIGEYKEHPNSVKLPTGKIFDYATPDETPQKMAELMKWYRQEKERLHPLIQVAEFHHRFILIHPFDDGNGRVARLVVNYILMRNEFLPIVIKSADKSNYLAALRNADTGNIKSLYKYMAEQLIWSMELGIKAAKGESIEESDDVDKELELFKKKILVKKYKPIERSRDICMQLLDKELLPLISRVNEEMKKFNEFFLEPRSAIDIQTPLNQAVNISLDKVKDVYTEIGNKIGPDSVFRHLQYTYRGDGIKEIKKYNYSISNGFEIEFDKYRYILRDSSNKISFTKHYDDKITDDEMLDLIKVLKKDLLYQVKQLYEK